MNTRGVFVNTKDYRIIIPVLNEQVVVQSVEFNDYIKSLSFPVTFVDSQSTDNTYEILYNNNYEIFKCKEERSIAAPVIFAASQASEENIIVLPVDCRVSNEELLSLSSHEFKWGGFLKKYNASGVIISLYLFIQNTIRTKLLKNLVWTNAMFFKRELFLDKARIFGFLEDVYLSDELKKISSPLILDGPVIASFRRYESRFLKRFCVNLKIMVLYRLKIKSISELKEIYSK